MSLSLLVLSKDSTLTADLNTLLADQFELHFCERIEQVLPRVKQLEPWGIVADLRETMQGGHLEGRVLEESRRLLPEAEIVVLTGDVCPEPLERHIACNRIGVLSSPTDADKLAETLLARMPAAKPEVTVKPATSVAKASSAEPGADFVLEGLSRRFETNTPKLKMMLADLEVAARHDVTVLLIGETGAGKTFLSRLIHEISPRHDEPFLPLACGALPSDLIESELFGHVKGAFTSAHADKDGKFVAAKRGTILLDEIDVLGMEQQVKLLRVIESGEFEPVGSNRTMKSEARLIVASNLELQPLVEQKRFRPDLYYRLNMLKFEIPPLRARKPDIIPLARKFIREQSAKHNVNVEHVEESMFAALMRYPWPGNVRELEHVIQRAVIYCRNGVLTPQQLPSHVVMCQAGPGNDGNMLSDRFLEGDSATSTLGAQVAFSEREIIEQTLFQHNNSRTNTARALGISRVTLYNKMKKYGMTK
jgi:two-component system, NtrC family, response regulator AtoC